MNQNHLPKSATEGNTSLSHPVFFLPPANLVWFDCCFFSFAFFFFQEKTLIKSIASCYKIYRYQIPNRFKPNTYPFILVRSDNIPRFNKENLMKQKHTVRKQQARTDLLRSRVEMHAHLLGFHECRCWLGSAAEYGNERRSSRRKKNPVKYECNWKATFNCVHYSTSAALIWVLFEVRRLYQPQNVQLNASLFKRVGLILLHCFYPPAVFQWDLVKRREKKGKKGESVSIFLSGWYTRCWSFWRGGSYL